MTTIPFHDTGPVIKDGKILAPSHCCDACECVKWPADLTQMTIALELDGDEWEPHSDGILAGCTQYPGNNAGAPAYIEQRFEYKPCDRVVFPCPPGSPALGVFCRGGYLQDDDSVYARLLWQCCPVVCDAYHPDFDSAGTQTIRWSWEVTTFTGCTINHGWDRQWSDAEICRLGWSPKMRLTYQCSSDLYSCDRPTSSDDAGFGPPVVSDAWICGQFNSGGTWNLLDQDADAQIAAAIANGDLPPEFKVSIPAPPKITWTWP